MGLEGIAFLIIVIVIAIVFAGTQIQAFLDGISATVKNQQNQADTKIPKPPVNTPVCDLLVTFSPRVSGSLASGNILHLNENGGTITYKWQNCHLQQMTWLNFAQLMDWSRSLSISADQLPKNELGVPLIAVFDETFKVNFKLVDANGNTLLIPQHQSIPFKVTSRILADQEFTYTIKFFNLAKQDYKLEITIDSNNYRFGNHNFGEPYIQTISAPK